MDEIQQMNAALASNTVAQFFVKQTGRGKGYYKAQRCTLQNSLGLQLVEDCKKGGVALRVWVLFTWKGLQVHLLLVSNTSDIVMG